MSEPSSLDQVKQEQTVKLKLKVDLQRHKGAIIWADTAEMQTFPYHVMKADNLDMNVKTALRI